jgi:hypothetical protein
LVDTAQPWLLAVWLIGVTFFSLRLGIGFATTLSLRFERKTVPAELVEQVAALGRRLGIRATARVFSSSRVREAMVVGFLRPVILLPLAWLTELPPHVLRAVIAHELAHIQRSDLWVNLLQRVIETRTGGSTFTGDQPHLAASFSGGKRMNLLHRVRYVLELGSASKSFCWGPVGLLVLILPVGVLTASLLISPFGPPAVLAQDDRGDGDRRGGEQRESEADSGRAQLERTFAGYDENKNGKVSLEEFIAALGGKDNPRVLTAAKQQFAKADRNGDNEPLASRQVCFVAKLSDGDASNKFHHEVGATVGRLAGVEHSGDVRMVHQRQCLPLRLEAGDDLPGIHASLKDLERHFTPHGMLLLGHEDDAKTPLANLFQQKKTPLEAAERGTRRALTASRLARSLLE